MIINVERIMNSVVYGQTPYGSIEVKWVGDKPNIDETYNIELDIDRVLVWNLDVYLVSNEKPAIISNGIGTSLFGVLESVDDDGYSVLRIGDSIIPFFAHGSSFSIGSSIKIIADSISAYPVSY